MKKNILFLATGAFIVFAQITSCTSPAQKVEDEQENVSQAKKDLDKANEEYATDMATFKKENADRIAANDKSIAEFKARIASQKLDAKADYAKRVAELEAKNSDFKKKLDDYEGSSKDNWTKFKEEFNRDMEDLGTSLKNLTTKNNK